MLTIRKKFAFALTVIFILVIVFLNKFLGEFSNRSFESFVEGDMKEIYSSSLKSFDDYMIINKINKDSMDIERLDSNLISFMVNRVNCHGFIYDLKGNKVTSSLINSKTVDLNVISSRPNSFFQALDNKAIVNIEYTNTGVAGKLTYCAYGKDNKPVGAIVFIKDYSDIFATNSQTKRIVLIMVISTFLLMFLAIYYLSSKIVKPIILLKDKTQEVTSGNYPEEIRVKSNDEIGILASTFNLMIKRLKLKEQKERDFFRNVTHELKTPLTNISGYAQILREDDFEDEEFKKRSLDRIIFESNRMYKLVTSLLDISKQSSDLSDLSFEQLELKENIKSIIEMQRPKINEKNLKVNFNGGSCIIKGNKQYMIMLFENLIANAIKYSDCNTEINISVESKESEAYFYITSEGKEIPITMTEKIFEPFVKVENSGFTCKDSTGLGLYICKNIVEAHKGSIVVEVNKNVSTFKVSLPLIN